VINLLSQEMRLERQYGRKNRILVGYVFALLITAVLVAIVMLGSLLFFGTDESSLKSEIDENTVIIASLQTKTKDLNQTVSKLELVNKLYENGITFSTLIPKIGSLLPEGTVLNGLSLTGESTDALSLDVDLENPELAAVLIRNLVDSDLFEAADIGNLNPKGAEGERYRFGTVVRVSFEGSAEAKRKAEAAIKAEAARKLEESATRQ
jgi:Tfp pilus assembly protein PilN